MHEKGRAASGHDATGASRREFLRLALLGGVAGFVAVGSPTSRAFAAGPAEALLLTCMDYRLIHATERYMTGRGLRDKYDQIILAGASLGALTEKYPAWNRTFWEHLEVAIQLHKIRRVMVMDHRDCGAYKVLLGEDFAEDPVRERATHARQLKDLGQRIKDKYVQLEVELLLMSLDGRVEVIA